MYKKTTQILRKLYLLCLLTLLSVSAFSQTTYYVKSGGTGNGSSWDSPLGSLPALGNNLNNVHIYIAEGNYNVNNTYSYVGSTVLIQGGFPTDATGTDLSGYNPETYISRILKSATTRFVNISATTNDFTNNKLTIKGIYFQSTGTTATVGSILNHEAGTRYYQLKVEDCHIHDSRGSSGFFRIAAGNNGKVTHWFHNNKFYRNTMGATGPFEYTTVNGDVKVLISNNLFGEGNATDGTGFYATSAGNSTTSQTRFYIIGNIFSCGTASSTTGGIYLTSAGNIMIKNNVFLGVRGNNYGGAIFATGVGGLQIEDNYFIQNYTNNTGVGAGGAIAIEAGIRTGSIVTSNYIKNNFFYENKVNTTTGGGSSISFATGTVGTGANYDIEGNIFAYNSALQGTGTNRQAVIQTRGSVIGNIRNNIFYGNKNSGGDQDSFAEIKAASVANVIGVIDDNKFQLTNAAAYTGNNLQAKIIAGTNNTFGTTKADIASLNPGDFVIDCYTGSVGCFKIDDSDAAIAKISKVGISTFKSHATNWPEKDLDNSSINNGAMVLDSSTKPLVVTRIKNPAKTLGTDSSLKGAVAYDTEKKCLMLFDGEKWDCLAKGCDKSIYDVLESIKGELGSL
ncbi:hypothetical protein [Empedobacter brevis]|uniref:Right handed beta helix domain-containing protein n=1 Tax=Empedobacter brevis NBRC 14943 = ATCC 43319 TaxID=1218108 RepID=A0A511NK18_9FLAO|nr:hypothetical protein [Empedobacter brevis]GEM53149.1 hypothetical protein EB1_29390 [Empedobacter brevis NBRC 14943 = ATCC 43319]